MIVFSLSVDMLVKTHVYTYVDSLIVHNSFERLIELEYYVIKIIENVEFQETLKGNLSSNLVESSCNDQEWL